METKPVTDLFLEVNPQWLHLAYVALNRPIASSSLVVIGDGTELDRVCDTVQLAVKAMAGWKNMQIEMGFRSKRFVLGRRLDNATSTIMVAHYKSAGITGQQFNGLVLYYRVDEDALDLRMAILPFIREGCGVEHIR